MPQRIAKLTAVSALMIFLGLVAIILGALQMSRDVEVVGSFFFVGGWLLAGLMVVASHLKGILAILSKKHESSDR